MRLNTHDRTPRPAPSKFVKGLWGLSACLLFGIFGLASFACFSYANSYVGGAVCLLIPFVLTGLVLIPLKDMERAYVELKEDEICVVDYYWGIRKEKHFLCSDITSAEIHLGSSRKVRGYRIGAVGMKYIVFRQGNRYLFKIIDLPETETIFKKYIR